MLNGAMDHNFIDVTRIRRHDNDIRTTASGTTF